MTAVLGERTMAIKMPKEFDIDFDSTVSVRFPLAHGFLFAADGGGRLDATLAQPGP